MALISQARPMMKMQLLGDSGLRVSQLCLGTMTFGEDWGWGASKEVSREIFDAYVEAGGNFIDTASPYTNGTSEKFIGEFVATDRDSFVVATKFTLPDQFEEIQPATKVGNARKNLRRSIEASLKRLNTDHIDVLYLHVWDFTTPTDEIMRTLDDLVTSGKVLYLGISDTPAWIVARAQTTAQFRGWTPFSVLQIEYSLIERTVERDLIPMADALGMTVAPWSPLAGGVLSGKYSSGEQTNRGRDVPERSLQIAKIVGEQAEKTGCTPSQLSLAWLLAKNTIPILGARKTDQFKDNLGCLDVKISPETMQTLDEASKIEPGFPHDFLHGDFVQQRVLGGKKELLDGISPRA
ncbi:aldo-keto reductase IolS [Abditibacteriota bacterium]|nr:aldo-keto reductase IolS [Abditibacteriota bacterium]